MLDSIAIAVPDSGRTRCMPCPIGQCCVVMWFVRPDDHRGKKNDDRLYDICKVWLVSGSSAATAGRIARLLRAINKPQPSCWVSQRKGRPQGTPPRDPDLGRLCLSFRDAAAGLGVFAARQVILC
jgi:hypothetical protein